MTKCPLCKKETVQEFRPFCSQRCQQKDLGQWLLGTYRIPTEETQEPPLTSEDED